MKIKIVVTDDDGKVFSGEVNLTKEKGTNKPQIDKVKKINKGGPRDRLQDLADENFFQNPKSMKNMIEELKNRSYHYKLGDLTRPLQSMTRDKILRRDSIKNEEGKTKLHWVNW